MKTLCSYQSYAEMHSSPKGLLTTMSNLARAALIIHFVEVKNGFGQKNCCPMGSYKVRDTQLIRPRVRKFCERFDVKEGMAFGKASE